MDDDWTVSKRGERIDSDKKIDHLLDMTHARMALSVWKKTMSFTFFQMVMGLAIVDTAAGQALIGETVFHDHLNALEARVMSAKFLPSGVIAPPRCIGGAAKALGTASSSIFIMETWGVLEFVVVQDLIPPLLSVHMLSSVGAVIDLDKGTFCTRETRDDPKPLIVLPSGHVALNVIRNMWDFFPSGWPSCVACGVLSGRYFP